MKSFTRVVVYWDTWLEGPASLQCVQSVDSEYCMWVCVCVFVCVCVQLYGL